jgi:hypothetical protein
MTGCNLQPLARSCSTHETPRRIAVVECKGGKARLANPAAVMAGKNSAVREVHAICAAISGDSGVGVATRAWVWIGGPLMGMGTYPGSVATRAWVWIGGYRETDDKGRTTGCNSRLGVDWGRMLLTEISSSFVATRAWVWIGGPQRTPPPQQTPSCNSRLGVDWGSTTSRLVCKTPSVATRAWVWIGGCAPPSTPPGRAVATRAWVWIGGRKKTKT